MHVSYSILIPLPIRGEKFDYSVWAPKMEGKYVAHACSSPILPRDKFPIPYMHEKVFSDLLPI